ncbi:hypothetical protein PMIN03_007922 [Paraphaeosphaeria minitans]
MDPNLTLAHITHNTSMILLHHSIAYPEKDWSDYVALPKDCSAQTCQHAAVETANIVNKFLTHTMVPFVNAQFAFCTFIAAKVLLYEHQATRRPLRSEFDRMKRNLEEMSSRWASAGQHPGQQPEQGYPQQSAAIPSPYPAAVSEGVLPNAQALNSVFLTGHSLQDQCLLSLSDALMDSQFLDMDRVITFEDTNFYLPDDACQWQKFS